MTCHNSVRPTVLLHTWPFCEPQPPSSHSRAPPLRGLSACEVFCPWCPPKCPVRPWSPSSASSWCSRRFWSSLASWPPLLTLPRQPRLLSARCRICPTQIRTRLRRQRTLRTLRTRRQRTGRRFWSGCPHLSTWFSVGSAKKGKLATRGDLK